MERLTTSRRAFMHQLAAIAGAAIIPSALRGDSPVESEEETNEHICQRTFDLATRQSLRNLPMSDVIVAVGGSFVGTPYAAHTLEQPGEERLVVNLHALDCVTFVESTLALSRCIKVRKHTFAEFKKQLQLVRYRGGSINGYPSRLHYFSDWIDDNEKKKLVRSVSREIGGVVYEKSVSFMSSHPASYKQLGKKPILEKIKQVEMSLNARTHHFIPKEQLKKIENKLLSGDIIGLTTATEGLDITHTGMALRADGMVKYLHAPLSTGKVQVTKQSLVDYMDAQQNLTGIMVARPLEPVS